MKYTYLDDKFFSRLETLSFNLKSNLSGYFGGKHLVNTYGQTVEFADYRDYQLGDDIRRIDWNLYSRFEKYFIKLFTDERQMQVQLFIDCSASMGKNKPEKSSYATAAAAALGYLAVHNMDKVSFHIMKGDSAENPFGTIVGKSSFFRAIKSLESVAFDGDTDIESCITKTDVSAGNGLSVIISDFFTDSDWKKAVDYLLFKKRQVLLMQVLMPEELDPSYDGRVNLIDSESEDVLDGKNLRIKINKGLQAAYQEALKTFVGDIEDFCKKRDVGYVLLNTDTPIEKVLFSELFKTGMLS